MVARRKANAKEIRLVHGDEDAKNAE